MKKKKDVRFSLIDYNLSNDGVNHKLVQETLPSLVMCKRTRKCKHIFIIIIIALNHMCLYVYSCNTAKIALRDIDVRKCNNVTQKRLITLLFAVMTSNRWKGTYKVSHDITHDFYMRMMDVC